MFFLLTMIPVIVGLMQLPFAQATCYVPPNNECARLYEHTRCAGAHLTAYPGTYNKWVGSSFNDKATSVVVRAGCTLTIYQHGNGGGKSKSLGDAKHSYWYDLGRQSIVSGFLAFGNWNDWVSSFKCTCGDCPVGFFRIAGSYQCYKLYNDIYRDWDQSKAKCQARSLKLAEPPNPVAVRKYLVEDLGNERWVHIGARGDGSVMKWLSNGQEISSNDPHWVPGHPGTVQTGACLQLMSHTPHLQESPNQPFFSGPCTWKQYTLCQTQRTCQCGVANTARIIGGAEVNPKRKYPWQVGVIGKSICGGTIINDRWILTAAHCFTDHKTCKLNNDPDTKVFVGEHKRDDQADDVADTKQYSIKTWIKHPHYSCHPHYNYDFGLLELTEAIPFNSVIRPVCLPTDDIDKYGGQTGIVTGWGKTSNKGHTSKFLKEVEVPIIPPNNRCGSWGYLEAMKICAGGEEGKSMCKGDSGGGLYVVDENGKYVLVGVVSYVSSTGCDDTDYPGVYARVSNVLPWITEHTSNANKCD